MRVLCECCVKTVCVLWEECGSAVGGVCECCGRTVGVLWEDCGSAVGGLGGL